MRIQRTVTAHVHVTGLRGSQHAVQLPHVEKCTFALAYLMLFGDSTYPFAGMRISPQGEICMGALVLATYYWSMYSTYLKRSQYGMNLS